MFTGTLTHRKSEEIGQHADGVEEEGDDGEQNVGAQNAERGNAPEIAEEFLLLYGEPGEKYDGREEVPVHTRVQFSGSRACWQGALMSFLYF